MATLTPVDGDPFAGQPATFTPIDHDPFVDAPAPAKPAVHGSFLPLTRDETGVHFDSNAGVLGALKSAFTLPGDVAAGQVDPMSPEGFDRTMGLATAALPLPPPVRARTAGFLSNTVRPATAADVKAPTAEALRAASSAAYDQARGAGLDYSPSAVRDFATQIKLGLESDGILSELAPKTHAILDKLANPPEGAVAVPFGNLEAARRAFGKAGRDFNNPTDQEAARHAVTGVDNFMSSADQNSVVGGPVAASSPGMGGGNLADRASAVSQAVTDARSNWSAAKRVEQLNGVENRADLNAAVANSGQNIDNAIRQRARDILVRPKERAGYTPDEISAIEDVARGTPTRNAVRFLGNLFGGGGGLGAFITGMTGGTLGAAAGGSLGAVAGAAPALVGVMAKKAGSAMTRRTLNNVAKQTVKRSPLFDQLLQNAAPVENLSPDAQSVLWRLQMMNGAQPQ